MVEPVEDGAVVVVRYDPEWPQQFDVEAAALRRVLGDAVAEIEHIGSTAVPGMWANPIVDIMAGTHAPSQPSRRHIDAFETLGYRFRGEDGRRPGRFIFHKREENWCNLSIVRYGSHLWDNNIFVRDYLVAHPEEAATYSAVKRRIAALRTESPQGYQDGKRDFVDELRQTAMAWATAVPGKSDHRPSD